MPATHEGDRVLSKQSSRQAAVAGSTEPVVCSAIVPCFNAQATLAETLRSVLANSNFSEVVVIDDGSTDNTIAVAQSFSPPVSILTGPNRGVSAARNRGILRTRGDWVQFVDSDDVLTPTTLAERLSDASEHGADVVITDWAEFETDGDISAGRTRKRSADWRSFLEHGPEIACATTFWAPPAAILYRRQLVERIGGFREDLPVVQDARFLFDAAYQGAIIVHSVHVGAYYRVRQNSLSRRDDASFWLDILHNGETMGQSWLKRGPLNAPQQQALARVFQGAAGALVRMGHHKAHYAARLLAEHGGRLDMKSRMGLRLMRLLGGDVVQNTFRTGGLLSRFFRGRG